MILTIDKCERHNMSKDKKWYVEIKTHTIGVTHICPLCKVEDYRRKFFTTPVDAMNFVETLK